MPSNAPTTPARLARELASHARELRTLVVAELHERPGELAWLRARLGLRDAGEFADVYAQSVSYVLLAARWFSHAQPDLEFCRANIRGLVPATSAAVLDLLERLVDGDLGPALARALDRLAAALAELDLATIFHGVRDPVLDFYEQFLAAYDPQLRRKHGVYYTPAELAEYLVRSVDAGLRERFGLRLGLADTTPAAALAGSGEARGRSEAERPFVRILDPAAGTGTFLVQVIAVVHETMTAEYERAGLDATAARRAWAEYVRARLLPRLYGFELMLAPYLIAQLRIGLALAQTGFAWGPEDRLRLDLTDALEARPNLERAATVIIGNPPYKRGPGPRGDYAERVVAAYKHAVRDERNRQPLADDYLAFIGLADDHLERAGAGVLALVVNGTCLSGRLHRGLRARLLARFDFIALCDLHGSQLVALREELGDELDENVFEIRQAVAVLMAERRPGSGKRSPTVVHRDLLGSRAAKLAWLRERARAAPLREHTPIDPRPPLCLFTSADPTPPEYPGFVPLTELFEFFSVSAKPGKDELLVCFEADEVIPKLRAGKAALAERATLTEAERKLAARPPERDFDPACIRRYCYRPGDTRFVYYDPSIWTRPVTALAERLSGAPVLLTTKIVKDASFAHAWVTRDLADVICLSATSSVNCYSFVLTEALAVERFTGPLGAELTPLQVFDYVYALLHSPDYRRRYAAALRHDFARIPIPRDRVELETLARLGAELRALHSFESHAEPPPDVARFVDGGDRRVLQVGEPRRRLVPEPRPGHGTVRINERARFEGVPEPAWGFRVGGYQLLHKWLSDRKRAGRSLGDADIEHYRRLVGLCLRTIELMTRIDEHIAQRGGWSELSRPR